MNFNDLDNQQARVTSDLHTKLISRKSFIAGYLIFGNLADNAFDPKLLLVICLSVSGASQVIASIAMYSCNMSQQEISDAVHITNDSCQFFYAGINIITTI